MLFRPMLVPVTTRFAITALAAATLFLPLALSVRAQEPHHSASEHSYDRIVEIRIDRVEEPEGAWSGPSTPDTTGMVDSPVGIRTPLPASLAEKQS